jgi:enoyl-CoA hydratase/carnithine racemase
MRFQALALSRQGAVASLELRRPESGRVGEALLGELEQACAAIHDDDAVTVVLLTAADGAFDWAWADDEAPAFSRLPFRCLELMAQPVVACAPGGASGAGLELLLACDVRVAAEGARFAMPAGAMPRAGATQRLPRLIGRARASELLLLGEPIDAQTALAWGLINTVGADASAAAEIAGRLAASIASRGPLAVRYAKEAVLRGLDMPLEQALRYETDLTIILQTTADRAEGVDAFLRKRPPRFMGR